MSPRSNCSRTKLASKCVGRSKRLTQPKLNLENQFQTPSRFSSLTLSLSHPHTPAPRAISAVGVVSVSVSVSKCSSFYLCRVVVFSAMVVVVAVAIAVLRLLLLMGSRDPMTTMSTSSASPVKISRHNAI